MAGAVLWLYAHTHTLTRYVHTSSCVLIIHGTLHTSLCSTMYTVHVCTQTHTMIFTEWVSNTLYCAYFGSKPSPKRWTFSDKKKKKTLHNEIETFTFNFCGNSFWLWVAYGQCTRVRVFVTSYIVVDRSNAFASHWKFMLCTIACRLFLSFFSSFSGWFL